MKKLTLFLLLFPKVVLCQMAINNSTIIKKWTNAVINIEVRNKGQIASGSAVFLTYNNRLLLLTARHVVHDWTSADSNKITDMIILVESFTERDIKDIYDSARKTYTFVGDFHFLTFGRGTGMRWAFSSKAVDLAVIDLSNDVPGQSFANTLFIRGYRPIFVQDIDTLCNIKEGDKIMAVGYPVESEVDTNKAGPLLKFRSRFVSLPMLTEGTTNGISDDLYFDANLFVYHGFSGGPIIKNNQLVGIVHGGYPHPIQKQSGQLPLYLRLQLQLIKSTHIMPLLRQLENMKH